MEKRKKELTVCSNPDCRLEFLKDKSEISRNKKINRKNYCSLSCSGKINNKHLLNYVESNTKYLIPDNKKDDYTGLREHLRRAKKRDPKFNITIDDLFDQWVLQNGICVYSGVKLNHPKDGGSNIIKASLDRIDSNKGYIKGNIQFISIICNHAKNNLTHNEMLEFCKIMSKI